MMLRPAWGSFRFRQKVGKQEILPLPGTYSARQGASQAGGLAFALADAASWLGSGQVSGAPRKGAGRTSRSQAGASQAKACQAGASQAGACQAGASKADPDKASYLFREMDAPPSA